MVELKTTAWVILGLACPVGSRTWWVALLLVVGLAALGVAGLLVFTKRR